MAKDDESLGPLFGGDRLKANRRTRRVGPPKIAADPVWSGATDEEREVALSVLEALNRARASFGMPHLPKARLSPSSAIPVIRRLRELRELLAGTRDDPCEVLRCCAMARVALHATAKDEAVRAGDYATTRTIFDDDDKWQSVLNAGRRWARGDRAIHGQQPQREPESAPAKPRGVASHGPRR